MMNTRPPLPPFNEVSAKEKVQLAENAWNTSDPEKVASAYTVDSEWRNRAEIFSGREKIIEFLTRKWQKEMGYRLKKELWCFDGNRIAVTFKYEWHDESGQWHRSYGNELWEFSPEGLMQRRIASINDKPISAASRELI
ncbi:MAG: nuclear transport factor 2 (NTF2) superfamily protein [Candidatus Endobugula sp.]|jgi:nuclear transport factor 2 (NTF2) superfamily protein